MTDRPAFAVSVPVLRCWAAGVPLGLAAAEVAEFEPSSSQEVPPSLAVLLGLTRPTPQGEHREPGIERRDLNERVDRTLRLTAGGRSALVRVEGPVRIRTVSGGEVLPTPMALAHRGLGPVIGFLQEDGRVVVLLDVAGVVGLAAAAALPPRPAGEKRTC